MLPNVAPDAVREDQILHALKKREKEGTSFCTLACEFGISNATLAVHPNDSLTCRKAHKKQKLSPTGERVLEKWCQQENIWSFPPLNKFVKSDSISFGTKVCRAVTEVLIPI